MNKTRLNSFCARSPLQSSGKSYDIFRLAELAGKHDITRLPFSIRLFLENLLRNEDGRHVSHEDVVKAADWTKTRGGSGEASFMPARVLMQDFTGVPAVVDLAAMRDAVKKIGGDPKSINPLVPVHLVVDHSVQVDHYGTPDAFAQNSKIEFDRNKERYVFLNWGQKAFKNFTVVPPETGIVHQVNLEHLARVVWTSEEDGKILAYPDTLVGTDSHTTMINGLGVLGWGVGGIEAEAVMLGQPVAMLIPQVVGFKMTGKLSPGATATDAVLTVVEMLRKKGVVGKFVEYYGSGVGSLPLADRATIANMAPEYGATVGIFPVDTRTLEYLALTGRTDEQIRLVEDYCKAQGLFRTDDAPEAAYTDTLELDLSTVKPCISGPKRPQDRIDLDAAKPAWTHALDGLLARDKNADKAAKTSVTHDGKTFDLAHGDVVIAAITSCTNTSNPSVLIAAGLLAKKAVEKGLTAKPWVKTSLAPGSKVVIDYLKEAGLLESLEALGFYLVGYGCTTCIGNSGPLAEPIQKAIEDKNLVATAVLSGNRNFEGRISPHVRANYLASPPLVVAYAIAGTMATDLVNEPLGEDQNGKPVYLKDVWPSDDEILTVVQRSVQKKMFETQYAAAAEGPEAWRKISSGSSELYPWDDASTYVKNPPYFEDFDGKPRPDADIKDARVLMILGDSTTTDHISPAGSIAADGPAGKYLKERGVEKKDFNSFGSRRGNHEVMMRGTFANIRIRNLMLDNIEGGQTTHQPGGERLSVFDASERYRADGVPTVIFAGKEYGTGSSRDWAGKGPRLLGVAAVIAASYERIHRSNLIGMGVLPLQFEDGQDAQSLGLTGKETVSITGLAGGFSTGMRAKVQAGDKTFTAIVRLDTPAEIEYYRYGGILSYVLAQMSKDKELVGAA
ncbi:MAG: aconitate hydratase AcnA [Elusimicrobia bacterium CG_4_9_14_3_um_filter_62_55]|nr:MAG: aconitate hydratase AcnA [Elusimicrobia bacterium CG_4_10_14_0_2_um_filter_63_34]PJB27098.1 MAG: aconitate hydratase AcnA [Elusimicrobia bacterium CG_4_9_14_3_um_filter_62_55]